MTTSQAELRSLITCYHPMYYFVY